MRRADALLTADERHELIDYLAHNPCAGDLIEGTGGIRKLRYAAKGKGKSGGVRVIYYMFDDAHPLFALLIYGKNEQADLSPVQHRAVAEFARGDQGGMESAMMGKKNIADELVASMQEALDYARGKRTKARVTKVRVESVDVRASRAKLVLTQEEMAVLLGVSLSGYRKWEQGERQPHGAARTLLRVMAQEPAAVARALKRAA